MPTHSARAHAGVDQQQDDGGVAAAGEVTTLTGSEQPRQVLGPDHVDRLLWQMRRLHAVHRVGRKVALGDRPSEEGVQAPVTVVSGGRLPTGQLAGEERPAVGLAVAGEQPDGVGKGLDGPGALVLRLQGAAELG
jgi:hypothetical protein